jgi:hypothetical protein
MLEEANQDKMIRSKDKQVKTKLPARIRDYSFPSYGITVKAESLAEAEQKLLEIIKQKSNE